MLDLTQAAAADTPNLIVSAAIFIVALSLLYRWKSKLSAPAVLAIGAAAGAIALG